MSGRIVVPKGLMEYVRLHSYPDDPPERIAALVCLHISENPIVSTDEQADSILQEADVMGLGPNSLRRLLNVFRRDKQER